MKALLRLGMIMLVCSSWWACEGLVDPELDTVPPVLVVDAWLMNQEGDTYVKLSETAPFNSPEPNKKVSAQTVYILDMMNDQKRIDFTEVEQGLYQPVDGGFYGEPGQKYQLKIVYQDQSYTAAAPLLPVPKLDSVTYVYKGEGDSQQAGYYITAHFQDPSGIRNYAWGRLFVNGENISPNAIDLFDDSNVDGRYLSLELPFALNFSDYGNPDSMKVEIEMNSLTQNAYEYYQGLGELIRGVSTNRVPQNPVSNIHGGALGYFTTSAVTKNTIVIRKP
ncbi:DUF4249 domain-containing protein [Rapidithrix thailandica]|uniref:DUF4249 domain-containing protein n=1 Tax=Rapidithrix thailandica TaxID=413964 RepID=A0AAW9S0K3_9BACT